MIQQQNCTKLFVHNLHNFYLLTICRTTGKDSTIMPTHTISAALSDRILSSINTLRPNYSIFIMSIV